MAEHQYKVGDEVMFSDDLSIKPKIWRIEKLLEDLHYRVQSIAYYSLDELENVKDDAPEHKHVKEEQLILHKDKARADEEHRLHAVAYKQMDKATFRGEVLQALASGKRPLATEMLVRYIRRDNHIYTLRHDDKPQIWIYREGVYVPNGRTFIEEITRDILGEAYTTHLHNDVVRKIQADTYIEQEEFFRRDRSVHVHHDALLDDAVEPVLGDVVPLVTQPMIDYLRGKSQK